MATKSHKMSLQPEQELAITELLAGKTDKQAAKEVKVCRETINRWRNHDPYFQAELNRRQQEIWNAHKMSLRGLVGDAIESITEAVRNNPTIAMKILEKCQGFAVIQAPCGPTDVAGILLELARERAEQELASTRREESTAQFLIRDPFEDARELAPLIKKHLLALRKEYGVK
jgi:hypothetical protein